MKLPMSVRSNLFLKEKVLDLQNLHQKNKSFKYRLNPFPSDCQKISQFLFFYLVYFEILMVKALRALAPLLLQCEKFAWPLHRVADIFVNT